MRVVKPTVRVLGCLLLAVAAAAQADVPKPAARPDAGAVYGLALDELRQRFGIAADDIVSLPLDEGDDPTQPGHRFLTEAWEPMLATAAPAMALFAQAAQIEACEFPPSKDRMFVGYDDVGIQLMQLAQLVAAHGWRQLPAAAAAALADVRTMLGHSRHAMRQPTMRGAMLGNAVEIDALWLLKATIAAAPAGDRLRDECRAVLDRHAAARPSLADLAEHGEAEIARMLAATFAEQPQSGAEEQPVDRARREQWPAIAAKVREIVHDGLAVLRRQPPATRDEIAAAARLLQERLIAGTRREEIETKLPTMTREQILDVLSRQLAGMMLPSLENLGAGEADVQQLVRACLELLGQ